MKIRVKVQSSVKWWAKSRVVAKRKCQCCEKNFLITLNCLYFHRNDLREERIELDREASFLKTRQGGSFLATLYAMFHRRRYKYTPRYKFCAVFSNLLPNVKPTLLVKVRGYFEMNTKRRILSGQATSLFNK